MLLTSKSILPDRYFIPSSRDEFYIFICKIIFSWRNIPWKNVFRFKNKNCTLDFAKNENWSEGRTHKTNAPYNIQDLKYRKWSELKCLARGVKDWLVDDITSRYLTQASDCRHVPNVSGSVDIKYWQKGV